jgi:S-formylglutathione hydrolase FrmB
MQPGDQGTVVVHRITSEVLRDNPLGDPVERDLLVYRPSGYEESSQPLPVLLAAAGFGGTGPMQFNRSPFSESLDRRLDRLIRTGACPPVLVVAPDCFTRVGGSQYINSSAVGRYEDYLTDEIVPFVRDHYRCGKWGVFGKSSGGYGAMALGMRHPEVFSALADHSGDSNFELCYLPDFGAALGAFQEAGSPEAFLEGMWADVNPSRKKYRHGLNMLAMAAHYSPNPDSPHLGIDFPFDLDTGRFRPDVWERWRAFDPVNMVERYAGNLARLKLIYVDCGGKDEFNLQWGARALERELRDHDLDVHFEEFDDGHFSLSYRFDRSLPLLAVALS